MTSLALPPIVAYPEEIATSPASLSYDSAQLIRFYEAMRLARTFEEKLAALYRQGKMLGAVYLGIGQEAVSVGSISHLQKGDLFSTVSRNLSAWFYKGVKPEHVLARWMGKNQPPSNGRELGLFLADLDEVGIAPFHNGSMASWIPSGAGFALSFKLRTKPNIYLAFTGDGATSPGDFYEGLNFASIHKLPLVIIAEMNHYAYSTPVQKQMPVENIADRAPAFNIYSEIAYGNDLFSVIAAAGRGIAHARSGGGPALIEFKTFRRRGHGEHDDGSYVPKEFREFWERRDPIDMYRRWLLGRAGLDPARLERVDREAADRVEAAVDYAESVPFPDPASVSERLFAPSSSDPDPNIQEAVFEPLQQIAIPALTSSRNTDREGGHF